MKFRPSHRIGIPPGTKALRLERAINGDGWALWISANADQSEGTYLRLNNDGSVYRVHARDDGTEDEFLVKPKDGE